VEEEREVEVGEIKNPLDFLSSIRYKSYNENNLTLHPSKLSWIKK